MRALLLPVKDLTNAKKRLMSVLTPEERFGLAEAMLADTIRAVQGVRAAEKIFVVTNYGPVMDLAKKNGWNGHQCDVADAAHSVSLAFWKWKLCQASGRSRARGGANHRAAKFTPGDGC